MAKSETSILKFNWHELPFIRLLIPLLLGILIAEFTPLSISLVAIVFIVLALVTFALSVLKKIRFRWFFGLSVALAILCLAFLRTQQHNELNHPQHFNQFLTESDYSIVGWVSDMPVHKNWVQTKVNVASLVTGEGEQLDVSGNLLIYLEKDSLSQQLAYGDLLQINSNLLKSEAPKNPNAFDFSNYLHYQNIHYQSFVKAGSWKVVGTKQGNFFIYNIYQLRKKLLRILKEELVEEEIFAVGAALTLGYRGELSEEVRNAYADTGAIHILAVSGLHVGLIYLILSWLLKAFPSYSTTQKVTKIVLALSGIWLFALLTGASASVIRAATMFSFIILGKYLQRSGNIYNSLAAAAFCSLLFQPYLLFTVGFQLSYLAVAGIVFFQPKIYRLLYLNNKIGDYMWQITAVSIAAQITVIPISLYYFHQFPIYFWLSSMIVIPSAFLVLTSAIVLFLFSTFIPIISHAGGAILYSILWLMNKVIFLIQNLPGGLIKGVWITGYEVFLLYGCIALVTLFLMRKTAKFAMLALASILLLGISRATVKINQYQNNSIVFYHIPRQTAIDFFDGFELYSVRSPEIAQRTLDFNTQQHRWASGSQTIHQFLLEQEAEQTFKNWKMQLPYFQFYDQRIALLNHNKLQSTDDPLEVDYLLIHENPYLRIEDVLAAIEPKVIIFDASNTRKNTERWSKECDVLGISYHNIYEKGAKVIKQQ